MGLMELPRTEPGQLIVTPHPALLDGQRNTVWELRAGESLYALLMRNVPELDGQRWAVSIGGLPVERHLWHHVYPKAGQVIEVRGGVGRSALAVVAMIALTYFTFGGGAIAGFTLGTSTALGTLAVQSAVYIAGSMLINKVLAPKPPKAVGQQQDSVYSITGARNQLRPYDPLPLLFGRVRLTPDLLSKPYTWYEGNDQYLGMLLCAGINVGRVEEFYNGDTLLGTYEGAQVFHAGYSQMPEQAIPLYSNADVIDGGQLIDTGSDPKHQPSAWVERTGSADTVRLVVAIEYQLYDKTSKGKDKSNTERIEIQYRPTGTTSWVSFGSYTLNSNTTKLHRVGLAKDVARGQYDVRVRTAGLNTNGSGAQAVFAWTTLTSVQVDEADYTGISRTGVKLKATGQLNGSPDELRAIGHADPISVWTGTEWVTQETSNPGAQILAYARGIVREGRLLGGMALSDAQIDLDSLKAFSLHCAANGYHYDFLIKDARNHDQVLSAIALAGFGQITWAGGRLGVVWAAQDQPLSGVVNMGVITKGQFQVDYSLSNAADGIEYTYIDDATWETKTLRVPAPGVTTMLNPAQVTGEGVTTEEHAARMARWHLAQSLYQYKDISYSTDIEHLSYQRLSVLAMQHDMTQWGYGGRVVAAVDSAGTVTLRLDEPVPAPPSGVGYIGLRIPGERVYRVLKVKPFTGESDTIELLDPWPDDAAMPGATPNNPAHDTLWIYDFKQTPGLRVRVVSVEPESDLKGASVRVVQEGAEFWNYVLTGDYVPSPSGSLLQTRPVASNLRVTEQQVVQGNTTYTELTATFDVSGPVSNVVVRAAVGGQELEEVAQTQTRMATWRIPSAGAYNIVVRPFSPDGEPGVAVSAAYVTVGAELPPKLVDLFDVEQRSGGVRIYTWGWLEETIQSPNFAGVEIRYIAGSVSSPIWEEMTPVGDTGYHTAPFEVVVPEAGTWTFSCRSRNSNGVLSTDARTVTRTLTANLGEQIGDITEEQAAQQRKIDQEIEARVQGDLENATAVADEATARAAAIATEQTDRANAIIAEQNARAAAIAAEATARSNAINASAAASAENLLNAQLALEAKITNEATLRQTADTSLASQIATISAGTGEQFDTGGGIWYFDTTAEGWTAVSGSGTTVVDGWLRPDFSANATQNVQSPLLTFDSTSYRYVKFRLRKVGNPGLWRGWVRWITAADSTYDTAKQVSIAEPTFDSNGIATVDFKDIPWPAGVTRVRIYPYSGMTSAGNYVEYDWIALGRPSPGASAAALQEERTARITGDSAEATQRTTLAAQLRGNYAGSDPAQLQSGLIYAERQVRITAEGVIATDVSNLQARMPAGNGGLATDASVTAEATARASADSALSERSTAMESRMPAGTGGLATAASVDTVANSVTIVDGKVTANSDSIQRFSASIGNVIAVQNPSFETVAGNIGWGTDIIGSNNTLPASTTFTDAYAAQGKYSVRMSGGPDAPNRTMYNSQQFSLQGVKRIWLSLDSRTAGAPPDGTQVRIGLRYYDVNGATITNTYIPWYTSTGGTWGWGQNVVSGWHTPPAGAASARVILYVQGLTAGVLLLDDVQVNLETATGAAIAQSLTTVSNTVTQQGQDIAAVSTRVNTFEARMPGGTGPLATAASVTAVEQASITRDEALGTRASTIEARMPTGSDKLANEARVVAAETAAANATGAVVARVGTVEARMPAGSGSLGAAADVTAAAAAAQAASDLAGSKGKVIYGSTQPVAADRKPENLWIDTTNGANTPKRWTSGTTWVAVTDKVALDAAAAAAAALSHSQTVDARVTTVEQASVTRDEALGTRTSTIEARMPTGSDKLANEARVVTAETAAATATGAVATQLAQVKVTADNANASVSTLSQVVSGSDAMTLTNRSFELDTDWSSNALVMSPLPADVGYFTSEYAKSGARGMRFNFGGTIATKTIYNIVRTTVTPGEVVKVGGFVRSIGVVPTAGRINIGIQYRDASNAIVSGGNLVGFYNFPGTAFDYSQGTISAKGVVPAGAVSAIMFIQTANQNTGHVMVDDVWMERVSNTEQSLMARHTVALNVDGLVSGTISENDGQRSSFSILASVFRVLTGGAATGMEWQANYLRVYGSGYQYIIGTGFGLNSDLVQWVGPNIGVANCTQANCTQAVTTSGVTIVRGSNANGRMEIMPTGIKVYDTVNTLPRIELGL